MASIFDTNIRPQSIAMLRGSESNSATNALRGISDLVQNRRTRKDRKIIQEQALAQQALQNERQARLDALNAKNVRSYIDARVDNQARADKEYNRKLKEQESKKAFYSTFLQEPEKRSVLASGSITDAITTSPEYSKRIEAMSVPTTEAERDKLGQEEIAKREALQAKFSNDLLDLTERTRPETKTEQIRRAQALSGHVGPDVATLLTESQKGNKEEIAKLQNDRDKLALKMHESKDKWYLDQGKLAKKSSKTGEITSYDIAKEFAKDLGSSEIDKLLDTAMKLGITPGVLSNKFIKENIDYDVGWWTSRSLKNRVAPEEKTVLDENGKKVTFKKGDKLSPKELLIYNADKLKSTGFKITPKESSLVGYLGEKISDYDKHIAALKGTGKTEYGVKDVQSYLKNLLKPEVQTKKSGGKTEEVNATPSTVEKSRTTPKKKSKATLTSTRDIVKKAIEKTEDKLKNRSMTPAETTLYKAFGYHPDISSAKRQDSINKARKERIQKYTAMMKEQQDENFRKRLLNNPEFRAKYLQDIKEGKAKFKETGAYIRPSINL